VDRREPVRKVRFAFGATASQTEQRLSQKGARVQKSPLERADSAPKPSFHCEIGIRFNALLRRSLSE
jgi:hypothetical protein